jgi:hypothetical protein
MSVVQLQVVLNGRGVLFGQKSGLSYAQYLSAVKTKSLIDRSCPAYTHAYEPTHAVAEMTPRIRYEYTNMLLLTCKHIILTGIFICCIMGIH